MNPAVVLLHVLNFALIGSLPFVFFQRGGKFNLWWWLTASPFIVLVGFVAAAFLGLVKPLTTLLQLFSVPLVLSSVALIFFTLGTHRIPLALWHQKDDAPKHIVTYGAYSKIRHPFYAAFLLAMLGVVVSAPHPVTLGALLFGFLVLNQTASREEKKLSLSEFGEEYKAYMAKTGRFWPRLGKAGATLSVKE